MNARSQRKRRSVSPKLLISEKRYFDVDDSNDNFSFIDDEINSNGGSLYETNVPSRLKRQTMPAQTERASNRDIVFEPIQFDGESEEDISSSTNKGRRKNKNNNNRNGGNVSSKGRNDDDNDDNKEPPLDKLVKDIRTKVKDSKKFWSNLPYQICNNDDIAASPSNDMNCWNGNKIDRYLLITNN